VVIDFRVRQRCNATSAHPNPIHSICCQGADAEVHRPGHDGNSDTATGYDVCYASGSCPQSSDPTTWKRAARSDQQTPLAAGTTEFFNVRANDLDEGWPSDGLQPGILCFVAISRTR
jgi:hypothetical protein